MNVCDWAISANDDHSKKILVVDAQGNFIYPDASKDSGIEPGQRIIDQKSSVSLKTNNFKKLRRSKKKANFQSSCDVVRQQFMNSVTNPRTVSTQTDQTWKMCQCMDKRNPTESVRSTASTIGDSNVLKDDDSNKFERYYFKQQPKDDNGLMFFFLMATVLIFLLILVCFAWNRSAPFTQIWNKFQNLSLRRKREISKLARVLKFIGRLFGR